MMQLLVLSASALLATAAQHRGLTLRAQHLVSSSYSTPIGHYGNPKCQCIGLDDAVGEVSVYITKDKKMNFPVEVGASCEPWDFDRHPSCQQGNDADFIRNGTDPSWCSNKWCYVDPCDCDIDAIGAFPVVSAYLRDATYQNHPVYASYQTCGNADTWTKSQHWEACVNQGTEEACGELAKCAWVGGRCAGKEAHGVCNKLDTLDESKFGESSCRCIGIDNLDGHLQLDLGGGKTSSAPAHWGSTCSAWDDKIEGCDKDPSQKVCGQKWCYVDPCSCSHTETPKISAYLHMAKFQGKTVYYHYGTCGGVDLFTKSKNTGACVNSKTESDCATKPKCGWTGDQCRGKELVTECRAPVRAHARALAPIGALALLSMFHI